MSAHDAIADFIAFMEASGVKPQEPIAHGLGSGDLIRFRCDGDSKGRKNGWAILYLDERPAGAFGNYRMNTGTLKWRASANRPALSAAEREALSKEWREARERRDAMRRDREKQASFDAGNRWRRAQWADPRHPYAVRKKIDARGLKQEGGKLMVPLFDEHGTLWNIQTIADDGTKRFLRGGRIEGCFTIIGEFTPETREAVFVEGYATGDSVHQASSFPVIVTFNTANMPPVARLWADRRPDLTFTVFADDDERTAQEMVARGLPYKNPGIETAEAVAASIGGYVAYPLGAPQGRAA